MSLSNLHNPKAAAKLIDDFRRRFSTKVCMAPFSDHDGSIVAAHTMSVKAVLSKIGKDGHVYAPKFSGRFSPDEYPIQIKRIGLREVSVFNGFCAKHDVSLFSCIENEPFYFARKQLFMLAYRSVARECYLKRKQHESLPSLDQFKEVHGITEPIAYKNEVFIQQAATLRGAEECEALKAKYDKYLVDESWDRLVTHAILFPKTPSLTACFVFQPFHDMEGNQLQDYENLEAEMSQLSITVMPLEQGGAVVFSWLDLSNSAPRCFFESVINTTNITSSVIHVVLDNCENFALSPRWYEALPQVTKDYLFSRVAIIEASITYLRNSRPELSAPYLGDWGAGNIAEF